MDFLHVIRRTRGGVGRYVSKLSRELEKQGHKCDVLSREDDLGINSLVKSHRLKDQVKRISSDYEVINAHDWSIALPLIGLEKVVATFHGYEAFPKLMLQRFVGSRIPLIVVSPRLKRIFPDSRLITEGVDLELFRRKKPLIGRDGLVGFCQAPTSYYGFPLVKGAADILDMRVALAGTGSTEPTIIRTGQLSEGEMAAFYSSLSAFVSIPERAGFNLCWLEALACGVPVVGNDEGIAGELPLVRIGSRDAGSIAAAIRRAIHNPPNYQKVRSLLKKKFTWERAADSYISAIEKHFEVR